LARPKPLGVHPRSLSPELASGEAREPDPTGQWPLYVYAEQIKLRGQRKAGELLEKLEKSTRAGARQKNSR
jgi:hypothetical protein